MTFSQYFNDVIILCARLVRVHGKERFKEMGKKGSKKGLLLWPHSHICISCAVDNISNNFHKMKHFKSKSKKTTRLHTALREYEPSSC